MIRQFLKDTGIYGIAGLISKGVSFFLLPLYTIALSPDDYGTIDILAVFYSLIAVTLPLEITQAVARFLAERKGQDIDRDHNTILVSTIGLIITLSAFTIFLIIGLLFKDDLSKLLLSDASKSNIFTVAVIYMFFTGMYYFFQNQLRWTLKSKLYALLAVIYTIINIALTIFFVLIEKCGVVGVFYAYLIAGIICSGMGWYFSRKNYSLVFSIKKMHEMLKFSLPLVPSSVGVIIINVAQRVMIKGLMSLSDLGLYGVGSRFSSIIQLGFQSVQGAITPLIYQNEEKEKTPYDLSLIFRYMAFFLVIAFTGISLFSIEIISLMTAPTFHSSYMIVPFLVLAECFTGFQNSFTPGLALAKRTDIIAYINIIGGLFALALSYILILHFGILGAAIAMLAQRCIMFLAQMYYSQKYYYVRYSFKKVIQALLTAILILILGWQASLQIESMILKVLLKGSLVVLLIIFLVFSIKLIEVKEIRKVGRMILEIKKRINTTRGN